ncbi:hypothetical protein UAY_02510 [Enterococcus moraviensis ATCC BAA-383]|uniref:WxL domain-containing protein n=1 Tax=Enterococcus moraviensis ATCC BAA-383 TaxID=1158609 RepID=R2SWR0_9ENTE|nr:WxL domain-containing protein [Enterococcus moraviensis]EOH97236.1 hypothetical protein UAY_02510 [Enterococcus moraviensis ATCC BAA-383]EOT71586.1 hypothetical protein I586_01393 [Enterococcus moraviensis ATCC BAA-383]
MKSSMFVTTRSKVLLLSVIFGVLFVGQAASAADINKATDLDVTFTPGALTLEAVSTISYASQTISVNDASYIPTNPAAINVVVSDARGTNAGWKLSGKLNGFKDNAAAASLPNASLNFKNTQAETNSDAEAPTPVNTVKLTSGAATATPFATAAAGAGAGTWTFTWPDAESKGVTLDVPAAMATLGKHTSTIDWTLADAP